MFEQGQTGFPWIDAIMTQLRNEGWIHNVARHAVACFLTRGDLWVSWEEGMKVSALLLYVVHHCKHICNLQFISNNGNNELISQNFKM